MLSFLGKLYKLVRRLRVTFTGGGKLLLLLTLPSLLSELPGLGKGFPILPSFCTTLCRRARLFHTLASPLCGKAFRGLCRFACSATVFLPRLFIRLRSLLI